METLEKKAGLRELNIDSRFEQDTHRYKHEVKNYSGITLLEEKNFTGGTSIKYWM